MFLGIPALSIYSAVPGVGAPQLENLLLLQETTISSPVLTVEFTGLTYPNAEYMLYMDDVTFVTGSRGAACAFAKDGTPLATTEFFTASRLDQNLAALVTRDANSSTIGYPDTAPAASGPTTLVFRTDSAGKLLWGMMTAQNRTQNSAGGPAFIVQRPSPTDPTINGVIIGDLTRTINMTAGSFKLFRRVLS